MASQRKVKSQTHLTYTKSGVSLSRGNLLIKQIAPLARATARAGANAKLGGFAGVFDLASLKLNDPLLLACTDGVGTKLQLAIQAAQHHGIGQDLVAMCVNDLIAQGARPLIFLDYLAMGRLDISLAKTIIRSISKACIQSQCVLLGGESAEMPGLYKSKDYDLAGFAVGAVERRSLLPRPGLRAGDILIGLSSTGAHANGYSLIRKILKQKKCRLHDRAGFNKRQTLAQAFLTPTRLYMNALKAANQGLGIKAMAHITGGGLSENLPRVMPPNCAAQIDLDSWQLPPLFAWLAQTGRISAREMLRVFNCGIGMVLIVSSSKAKPLCTYLQKLGEQPHLIGQLVPGKPMLQYRGTLF